MRLPFDMIVYHEVSLFKLVLRGISIVDIWDAFTSLLIYNGWTKEEYDTEMLRRIDLGW
jgi:hypothetical protein